MHIANHVQNDKYLFCNIIGLYVCESVATYSKPEYSYAYT